MPSTVDSFGSLKGSDEHKDSKGGRFGLTTAEIHQFQPPTIGEHYYYTPGSYTWICPPGITSVSVVCIGGGGGGIQFDFYAIWLSTVCGGGGTLAYKNNIPVVPGQGYDLVVGAGGTGYTHPAGSIPGLAGPNSNGGQSWFNNTSTCQAGGGYGGQCSWAVGSDQQQASAPVGDGGGRGGYAAGFNAVHPVGGGIAGAGGAGGYAGDGGGYSWPNVTYPSGGAGASGYPGHSLYYSIYGSMYYDHNGGPGGGVGPYGLGNTPGSSLADHGLSGSNGRNASLANPTPQYKAIPGGIGNWDYSTGIISAPGASGPIMNDASASNAGLHGGGGGNSGAGPSILMQYTPQGSRYIRTGPVGNGGNGCVRIIWGAGRSFPSNLTDEASSNGNVSFN